MATTYSKITGKVLPTKPSETAGGAKTSFGTTYTQMAGESASDYAARSGGGTTGGTQTGTTGGTQTGNAPNTYDPTTGVYTDTQGQGFSYAQAPAGATIVGGVGTTYTGGGTAQLGGGITQYFPPADATAIAFQQQQQFQQQQNLFTPTAPVSQPTQPLTTPTGLTPSKWGAFLPVATALDYFTAAFAHPFKTVEAALDPNKSVSDVVNNFFNKPEPLQVLDVAVAGGGYIATVLGINGLIATATKVGASIQAGTYIGGNAAKAAAGQIVEPIITKVPGQIAVNTATTKLSMSFLTKLTQAAAKHPLWVAGLVGTALYSLQYQANPVGDAAQSLSIAINEATKNGDIEGAREMKEYLDDIVNPDLMGQIVKWIPYANVLVGEATKREAIGLAAANAMEQAEREQMKIVANNAMEQKINSGLATEEEWKQYAEDNPYSAIAKIWTNAQVRAAEQPYYDMIYGKLVNGVYVPSPTEIAKREWQQEQYASQSYSNSYTGGTAAETKWEPPSSLNFGLLHTTGGYEATGAGVSAGGQTYTVTNNVDRDAVSNYLFGIPYAQLTDEQKAVVDKW